MINLETCINIALENNLNIRLAEISERLARLRADLEGIKAGTFKRDARNYDIVVKMEEIPGINQVEQFVFPGTDGRPVLLTSLGEIKETISPVQITRVDKQRVARFFANLEKGAALGMLPMALGRGIGAEMRNACGIASAGGVLASGLFSMYVVPVIYNLFTRRQKTLNV